jgi:hypothetical protein
VIFVVVVEGSPGKDRNTRYVMPPEIAVLSDASSRSIVPIDAARLARSTRARKWKGSGEAGNKTSNRGDFCGLLEPPLSKVSPPREPDEPEQSHAVTPHPLAILLG